MLSIGELIWISFRPLIRLVICVICGFVVTKADIFPPIAARGAGQVVLNIALPCLMFSKIVSAFTTDNVGALGPLILVSVIYEFIGVIIAWIVKKAFWVPHRFRFGILVAGGWGNVGDIPTSVIMSVTGAAPFNGVADQNLAIAYISVFILVFLITLFRMGAHRWIAMDYKGPDVEIEEIRQAMLVKRKAVYHYAQHLVCRVVRRQHVSILSVSGHHRPDVEKQQADTDTTMIGASAWQSSSNIANDLEFTSTHPVINNSGTSCSETNQATAAGIHSSFQNTTSSMTTETAIGRSSDSQAPEISEVTVACESPQRHLFRLSQVRIFVKSLFTPICSAIFIAFPIAVVPKLKALFIEVPGVDIPSAPDGQPPLAFIMDAATFIGAASVPLGLICLGSALARLRVPKKQWSSLPLGAIFWLAISRMVIVPILGILICEKLLVPVGIIPKDNKVIRFVCVLLSCLPTATTQVYLTQVYSGTGNADHLAAFLIPQYVLMFFSMTILTAYTINLIF